MKLILKDEHNYILRFDQDDELIQGLTQFCKTENIQAGLFHAIGSSKEVILSWYNIKNKKYTDKMFQEELEISSLTGNVATLKGESYIHMHGCFSNEAMQTYAGHIKKLIVGATCEVVLQTLQGRVERSHSEEIGLNLLS